MGCRLADRAHAHRSAHLCRGPDAARRLQPPEPQPARPARALARHHLVRLGGPALAVAGHRGHHGAGDDGSRDRRSAGPSSEPVNVHRWRSWPVRQATDADRSRCGRAARQQAGATGGSYRARAKTGEAGLGPASMEIRAGRVATGANHPARDHRRSDGGPERRHRCSDGGPEHRNKCYTEPPPCTSRPDCRPTWRPSLARRGSSAAWPLLKVYVEITLLKWA